MITVVHILSVSLPVFFFTTIWTYAKAFFRDSSIANKLTSPFLTATLLIHLGYLLLRTALFGHPPITGTFEILTLLAFCIAAAYWVIELRTNVRTTGYFILILAFFFQLASSIFIKDLYEVKPVLRNNLLGLHVMSALLGYAAITISAVYGFLYLMLYHQIKSSRFGIIYAKLPSLEMIEKMAVVSTEFGFVFLTVAIAVGLVWLPRAFETFSYFDPKLIGTAVVWALYGVGLGAKRAVGWQGRKIMILSIVGFAISCFSMTVVNMFFSGFHNFY